MNLADVMQALYASEIDCSVATAWDDGWDVELERGRVATARVDSLDAAARWLHEQAIARLTKSDYAKQRRPPRSSRAAAIETALRELVRLKAMKDRGDEASMREHDEKRASAWKAAEDALSQ